MEYMLKIHLFNTDIKKYVLKPHLNYLFLSIPQPVNLIEENRQNVLGLLRFKPKYQNISEAYFNHLRKKYNSDNIVFIGVHVRLTDKEAWLKHVSDGGRMPVPEEILYFMGQAKNVLKQYYYSKVHL